MAFDGLAEGRPTFHRQAVLRTPFGEADGRSAALEAWRLLVPRASDVIVEGDVSLLEMISGDAGIFAWRAWYIDAPRHRATRVAVMGRALGAAITEAFVVAETDTPSGAQLIETARRAPMPLIELGVALPPAAATVLPDYLVEAMPDWLTLKAALPLFQLEGEASAAEAFHLIAHHEGDEVGPETCAVIELLALRSLDGRVSIDLRAAAVQIDHWRRRFDTRPDAAD